MLTEWDPVSATGDTCRGTPETPESGDSMMTPCRVHACVDHSELCSSRRQYGISVTWVLHLFRRRQLRHTLRLHLCYYLLSLPILHPLNPRTHSMEGHHREGQARVPLIFGTALAGARQRHAVTRHSDLLHRLGRLFSDGRMQVKGVLFSSERGLVYGC